MKKMYILFSVLLSTAFMTNAQNTVVADAGAEYLGYANVFETIANGGAFVFGSGWGVADLKSVVDADAGSVTLKPNFNTYGDNPGDPFWIDPATGLGNKQFEGNTFVENNTNLIGSELTFTGGVASYTLDPSYVAIAFIKVFNADFSVLKLETAPLVAGQDFSITYTNVEPGDTTIQYGYQVLGLNANPIWENELGSIVIVDTVLGTDIPCEQKTWVVNVGSIEDYIDIHHSGNYLTNPSEENAITWIVTDNQGTIIAQETLINESLFNFNHDIPTTQTMNISAELINEVAGVACFVEDVLFWDTNNRWEFLNGNVPILGANDFIETTVSLYPNPSNELINISFDEDQLSKLELYDVTGKLLFKKDLNTNTYALNIANYPSGTYLVKVFNQNNVSVNKKIIKK